MRQVGSYRWPSGPAIKSDKAGRQARRQPAEEWARASRTTKIEWKKTLISNAMNVSFTVSCTLLQHIVYCETLHHTPAPLTMQAWLRTPAGHNEGQCILIRSPFEEGKRTIPRWKVDVNISLWKPSCVCCDDVWRGKSSWSYRGTYNTVIYVTLITVNMNSAVQVCNVFHHFSIINGWLSNSNMSVRRQQANESFRFIFIFKKRETVFPVNGENAKGQRYKCRCWRAGIDWCVFS